MYMEYPIPLNRGQMCQIAVGPRICSADISYWETLRSRGTPRYRHGQIRPMRVSLVRFYYVKTLKMGQYFGK